MEYTLEGKGQATQGKGLEDKRSVADHNQKLGLYFEDHLAH